MKVRNIIVSTLASAMIITMSSAAFAKGPEPVQQKPAHSTVQHMPVKAEHGKPQAHHKQKAHFIRVHRGDTLSGIAHKHHMSVAHLKRLNHLKGNKITVGQRLRIS
jgi:membrane-bound lytic murein transglycosylase D